MEKLFENGGNREKIECNTKGQNESKLWQSLRREMLTASNFRTVCRIRPTSSCTSTVKNILFPLSIDTVAIMYGCEKEEIARKELSAKFNKEIKACGLFIDKENLCLDVSPDGLIEKDNLVEIKCPLSAEHFTAEEAVQTLPQLKGIFDKKYLDKMNQNHRYFYQVQGQLNITQRNYCIFTIWTLKSFKTIHIIEIMLFGKIRCCPL